MKTELAIIEQQLHERPRAYLCVIVQKRAMENLICRFKMFFTKTQQIPFDTPKLKPLKKLTLSGYMVTPATVLVIPILFVYSFVFVLSLCFHHIFLRLEWLFSRITGFLD